MEYNEKSHKILHRIADMAFSTNSEKGKNT